MKSINDVLIFTFGMLAGILLDVVLIHISYDSAPNVVNRAISECEETLPRNQVCEIIAVPVEE